jgi:hypothetical protein
MAKELFVPNTDCEGDLNLLACFRVQTIDVQRPRVSVQRAGRERADTARSKAANTMSTGAGENRIYTNRQSRRS